MKALATLTLISLGVLLTVGFMTMPAGSAHHGESTCVVSALDQAACSTASKNMAIHHIDAYGSFTNIFLSIFVLAALILIFISLFGEYLQGLLPVFVAVENSISPHAIHLRRWLSLFILSPSFK